MNSLTLTPLTDKHGKPPLLRLGRAVPFFPCFSHFTFRFTHVPHHFRIGCHLIVSFFFLICGNICKKLIRLAFCLEVRIFCARKSEFIGRCWAYWVSLFCVRVNKFEVGFTHSQKILNRKYRISQFCIIQLS